MVKANKDQALPDEGIIIDGKIVDPNRDGKHKDVYKRGQAQGILRFEIVTTKPELERVIKAFPNDYKVFPVTITLVIGQHEYYGTLGYPKSLRNRPPVRNEWERWLLPWIAAKLEDKNGRDVKLAYAIKLGGFNVGKYEQPVKLGVVGNKIWVL
jgi:hypothetical protein